MFLGLLHLFDCIRRPRKGRSEDIFLQWHYSFHKIFLRSSPFRSNDVNISLPANWIIVHTFCNVMILWITKIVIPTSLWVIEIYIVIAHRHQQNLNPFLEKRIHYALMGFVHQKVLPLGVNLPFNFLHFLHQWKSQVTNHVHAYLTSFYLETVRTLTFVI